MSPELFHNLHMDDDERIKGSGGREECSTDGERKRRKSVRFILHRKLDFEKRIRRKFERTERELGAKVRIERKYRKE